MKLTPKEEKYLKAKEAYYEMTGDFGETTLLMEDWEFDELELELKEEGSCVIEMVGFKTKGTKVTHPTLMKSLDKIQFQTDYEPIDEFFKWLKSISFAGPLGFGPKFDGNAVNLVFKNGKLHKAITRGDGEEGQDVTDKLRHMVPNNIKLDSTLDSCEIRGEVVINKSIFEKKYGDVYSNPRNFVAGMLNRDQLAMDIIKDLSFMAFDVKLEEGYYLEDDVEELVKWGFESYKTNHASDSISTEDFLQIYNEFKTYREEECPYLMDGIVVKMPVECRELANEKEHHPLWALAIKFPPKVGITYINDIEWSLGTTGSLIPVAILEPVDLDGSIVKRVTLHNHEWATNKGCGIGAKIEIVKSGDIIPKVLTVLEKGDEIELITKYQGCKVELDGVHLRVENYEELPEYQIKRLHHGITALGIKGIGPALSVRIYWSGFKTIMSLFSINKELLIKSGQFKASRELDLLFENLEKLKEVDLWKIVNSFKFKGVGKTMSKEIAKEIAGIEPDYSGLEKAVVVRFSKYSSTGEILTIEIFVEKLKEVGIKVNYPEKIDMSQVGGIFEMTGKPTTHKIKADFVKELLDRGFIHGKLNKDCDFLITDSLNSKSSKMKKAEKLGVKILTYDDFLKNY